MFRSKKKAENTDFIQVLPIEGEEVDLANLELITGVLPLPGVIQRTDGTLMPAIFVRFDGMGASGEKTSRTLSFHPMALASACNFMSSVALLVVSDPDSVMDEIAAKAGKAVPASPYL